MYYPQIKNLRLIRDYKQEYVASYLGMSQPEYSRLETGTRNVRAMEIQQLAQLYGVRPDQIMQSEISLDTNSSSGRPYRRSEAVPKEIVDRLIANNGELLKTVLDNQNKTERIIERLMAFLDTNVKSEKISPENL